MLKEDCVEAVDGREDVVGEKEVPKTVSRVRTETAQRWPRWTGVGSRFSNMVVQEVNSGAVRNIMSLGLMVDYMVFAHCWTHL